MDSFSDACMNTTASGRSRNREEGSRTVQTLDLPLRINGRTNSKIPTNTSITVGKIKILAVDHTEVARTVDSIGLEDDFNIGHVGFGEVDDVCC